MLEALGIVMVALLIIVLVVWITWVSAGAGMAWGNDTDIIFLKRDATQSQAWSNEVAQRLNVIEKKLKIKKDKK